MGEELEFDYYHGIESEQFSFYRIPRLLIKDERFKGLSSDAKLLYGLMLDRMSLSIKNGWMDEENRAYIIYTVESMMEDLVCAKATCAKILKELDANTGIGLIERKRRGLGKPDIIYVKNFVTKSAENEEENPENICEPPEVQNLNFNEFNNFTSESSGTEPLEVQGLESAEFRDYTSRSSEIEPPEVKNLNFSRFKNDTSDGSIFEPMEVQVSAPSYTNNNYTNKNNNNSIQSIEGSRSSLAARLDQMDQSAAYRELIKKNISYDHYMTYGDPSTKELYNELYQLICEVVCMRTDNVKINGQVYPYDQVRSQFLKLDSNHLEYVIDSIDKTTTKISNIKSYMLTALYNAPNTINLYYKQRVQHDMYGGGKHEQSIV